MPFVMHWHCRGCGRKWDGEEITTSDPRVVREDWHSLDVCEVCAGASAPDVVRAPKKPRAKKCSSKPLT